MNTLRIAVVGYGIAGIAAAIQLRRQGHHIDHFECAATLSTQGAGLLLHPPALSLLKTLGLHDAVVRQGAVIARIYAENARQRKIMDWRYADHRVDSFGIGIQRGTLMQLLRDADPGSHRVFVSHRIIDVDPENGWLCDANKTRHGPYDVVVAADGAHSPIRQQLPTLVVRNRSYPWAALVCLVNAPDDWASDCLSQHFAGSRHVSHWPVGAASAQTPNRICIAIRVTHAEAMVTHTLGQWKPIIEPLCPALKSILKFAPSDTPMLPYPYRDVVLRRYVLGRVVLIGEAAHSMSPQLGQGVRMALEDAHKLAQSLQRRNTTAEALADFDRQRRTHVAPYQRLSRWLTPMFQSDSFILAQLRDRWMYPLSQIPVARRRALAMLCDEPP
jgi:2-polyprenyl-6-methoxyphenol hydroxylase-like FAD-dependent oxidoreductase